MTYTNLNVMKALYLLLFCLFFSATEAQTIRRVNNNPGVTGVNVYSSVQDAHDAAAPNDILLIEPSSSPGYNVTLTVTKPLKIYGNGYFLDINNELRADDRPSSITGIDLQPGASGTEIYGIENTGLDIFGASNVKIERCNIGTIWIYNRNKANTTNADVSDIVIHSNFIRSINTETSSGFIVNNVLITNNIISNDVNGAFLISAALDLRIQNWIIRNNYLSNPVGSITLCNSVFENNICDTESLDFTNVSCNYNVSSGNHFFSGLGNQNNFDFSNEFLGTGSDDEKLMIKAGSMLKTSASDAGEVGPFGGASPYIISGIPPIPSVTEMFNTGTGSNSAPLQVTVSVRSNN